MDNQTKTTVRRHRRIILFPLPYQGHINPMLQLANILYSKGFSITILHTNFNAPKASNYPHFTFTSIIDNGAENKGFSKSSSAVEFGEKFIFRQEGADELRNELERLLALGKEDEPVSCLITDALWHFAQPVADSLNLPRLVLRTTSVYSTIVYSSIPLLDDRGYFKLDESQMSSGSPEVTDMSPRRQSARLNKPIQIGSSTFKRKRNSSEDIQKEGRQSARLNKPIQIGSSTFKRKRNSAEAIKKEGGQRKKRKQKEVTQKKKKPDQETDSDEEFDMEKEKIQTGIESSKGTKRKYKKRKEKVIIWRSLRNRAAPLPLFTAIHKLGDKQKQAVEKMGFGKLLDFEVDAIPTKLGYFVVDNLKTETMEITAGDYTIKIDSESIERIFGIKDEGIGIRSIDPLPSLTGNVTRWRELYPTTKVSPADILNRMLGGGDDDSELFELDFLLLFLTTMLECTTNGICKLDVLNYMKDEVAIRDVNWNAYMLEKIKDCKARWDRDNPACYFTGPLTFLTLLYVDTVSCTGFNEEGTEIAIKFWTKEMLDKREKVELSNGGLGKCCSKLQISKKEGEKKEGKVEKIERRLKLFVKDKMRLEEDLQDMINERGKSEDVHKLLQEYKKLWDHKPAFKESDIGKYDAGTSGKDGKDSTGRNEPATNIKTVLSELANEYQLSTSSSEDEEKNEAGYEAGNIYSDSVIQTPHTSGGIENEGTEKQEAGNLYSDAVIQTPPTCGGNEDEETKQHDEQQPNPLAIVVYQTPIPICVVHSTPEKSEKHGGFPSGYTKEKLDEIFPGPETINKLKKAGKLTSKIKDVRSNTSAGKRSTPKGKYPNNFFYRNNNLSI